jgi:YcxB-like protein
MKIEFEKTVTLAEYREAQRRLTRPHRLLRYSVLGLILLYFWAAREAGEKVALAGLATAFLGHVLSSEVVQPVLGYRRRYGRDKATREPCHVVLDEHGISLTGKYVDCYRRWEAFRRYVETKNVILLCVDWKTDWKQVWAVPKRCLTPEQLEEWRIFLREREWKGTEAHPS